MADPNASESTMKRKAGRDSSRLKTRESPLRNSYHRGVSAFLSRDSRTDAVCERTSLLCILTCFASVLRWGTHLGRPPAVELNLASRKSFPCGHCNDPREVRKTYLITPCV